MTERDCFNQGLANYIPSGQIQPKRVFVNTILLENRHTNLCVVCGHFCAIMMELSSSSRDSMDHEA